MLSSLLCGSVSGAISATITFPLDLVRRRLQMQGFGGSRAREYNGFLDAFRSIWAREGLRGFYHGIIPEYFKVVPGVAIAFGTFETLKRAMGLRRSE